MMNGGGVAEWVLGGWQLGRILTLQDGFPFTVTCGPGNIQNGGGVCYPDSTGIDWQLPADERTRTHFFNTGLLLRAFCISHGSNNCRLSFHPRGSTSVATT